MSRKRPPLDPSRYQIDMETGCWVWAAYCRPSGYGQIYDPATGAMTYAHRYYYEHLVGPITPGNQIDHLCRNRACVNPGHLEDVTPSVNTRRSRLIDGKCKRGHDVTRPGGLYLYPDGRRECRTCKTDGLREWKSRSRVRTEHTV